MTQLQKSEIEWFLHNLYDERQSEDYVEKIVGLINWAKTKIGNNAIEETGNTRSGSRKSLPIDQSDHILISYPGSIRDGANRPLSLLQAVAESDLKGKFSILHVLPFTEYTSDDGFSISDYRKVNPDVGSWDDIRALGSRFRLMADLVLNHCSASHQWFERFLSGDEYFRDFFITADPNDEKLRKVVRPRATALLTRFTDHFDNDRFVWTTFGPDQVDLNYREPTVLLEMIRIMIEYLVVGVSVIRLDAVAYVWKELGTSCIHLPEAHCIVKLIRYVATAVRDDAIIITETNVPHDENISYFGNGYDEAHSVYNFSLPPLVLHSFVEGNAENLRNWASTLSTPSDATCFLNFLASHDGIGLLPLSGILSDDEHNSLIDAVVGRGGSVSYKTTKDGEIPYELNVSYFSAIVPTHVSQDTRVQAFLCAHAIMFSLAGIPAVYIHSCFATENWNEGVIQHGVKRAINRKPLSYSQLLQELADRDSNASRVLEGLNGLIEARKRLGPLHPDAPQQILDTTPPEVMAILRTSETEVLICLHNVASREIVLSISDLGAWIWKCGIAWKDELHGVDLYLTENSTVVLPPYSFRWFSSRFADVDENSNSQSVFCDELAIGR